MTMQDQETAAPPRKRRRGRLIAGLVIGAAVVLAIAVHVGSGQAGGTDTVTLNATGGGSMDVTYGVGDKNSQDTSAASPWQASYRVTGGMPFVSMVVQNGGSGSVSCSITEDGRVVVSNTSRGAYAVVQCSH